MSALQNASTHVLRGLPSRLKNRVDVALESWTWRRARLQWRLQTNIDLEIASRAEWIVYNDIFVDGEYDAFIHRALADANTLDRPLQVLDLGANVGYFTARFAHLAARQQNPPDFRIYAVEGSPRTFSELQRRLGDQPVFAERLELIHGLVGKREGYGFIYESRFHVMSALQQGSSTEGAKVPFVDLETLRVADAEIDLLKCDIEGAELNFLEHYPELLRRVRIATFEFHPNECDSARCLELLKAAGFHSDPSTFVHGNNSFTGVFWR